MPESEKPVRPSSTFDSTRWSLVDRAAGGNVESLAALGDLCRLYRRPLIRFAEMTFRVSAEEGEDLVQDLFRRMVEGKLLGLADPERGRFRTFLIQALKGDFLHARRKERTLKRGGAAPVQAGEVIENVKDESAGEVSETVDREWARVTMEAAEKRLEEDYRRRGKEQWFATLRGLAMEGGDAASYAKAGAALGLTPNHVAVEVHRYRKRLRDCFYQQVRETVSSLADELDEAEYLLRLLR